MQFFVNMNRNSRTEFIQNNQVLEEQTKEKKKFIQDAIQIDYCNTSKIFTQHTPSLSDVRVNNYLCYQQGQTLFKVTEILYEDKLIRIEDRFDVAANLATLGSSVSLIEDKNQIKEKNCSRSIQKVRLFCKNVVKASTAEKKDKKNIVKNIIKIFVSWLEKQQSSSKEKQALEKLVKLLKKQNYNNRLIKKIVINGQINKSFHKFLEDSAAEQIKYSRIQDKQSHYQALQIYKNLLQSSINGTQNMNSHSFSSNEGYSEQQSMNNHDKKKQPSGNFDSGTTSSGGLQSGEDKKIIKIEPVTECRKNKVILINNGMENEV